MTQLGLFTEPNGEPQYIEHPPKPIGALKVDSMFRLEPGGPVWWIEQKFGSRNGSAAGCNVVCNRIHRFADTPFYAWEYAERTVIPVTKE